MKIAIHQPNFLPWMGYFHKMAQCDLFVYYDNVEYTQKSFIRRVLIHKDNPQEEMFITVPLRKHSSFDTINSLLMLQNTKWQQRILSQIHQAYHAAPYYFQLEELLQLFFIEKAKVENLASFNTSILDYMKDWLRLNSKTILASNLDVQSKSTDAVIEIIEQLNGTIYISGNGAKKYHDPAKFKAHNIQLSYPDFSSKFDKMDIPFHFKYKSILSYMAHFSADEVREMVR